MTAHFPLSKHNLDRLKSQPMLIIRGYEGLYNRVKVCAAFSFYELELCVDVSHPLLLAHVNNLSRVSLVYRDSLMQERLAIPESLEEFVESLRQTAAMGYYEASRLKDEIKSFAEAFADF